MQPNINQYIYIQVESLDMEEAKQEYKSRIADMNDHFFAIDIPINEKTGKFKRLYVGDQLSAYYMTSDGSKNFFNTKVAGLKEEKIRLVLIHRPEPSSITKVQRRNYLRVPADLEIAVQLAQHTRFVSLTEDLSGGGLSFICDGNVSIMADDEIHCWLLIHFRNEAIEHVPFKGNVIRVKELRDIGRKLVMISFSDILDSDQQKIVRYCLERQLELRKK